MQLQRADVILRGGTVVDPATGRHGPADVVVEGGKVALVGSADGITATQDLDCRGALVTPGLLDAHTHIFAHVSKVGAPVDEAHFARGVVAACDAGTSGASTFPAFDRYVVRPARTRVLCFLNVSVLGLIDFRFGELLNPDTLVPEDAIDVAARHPEIVRGFKIRLSTDVVGDRGDELLAKAIEVGDEAQLPVMVHIGETADPLPTVLARLRAGDIVAHCYTGKPHNILGDGRVSDAVLDARERGVLFESAHGKSNLSFEVSRRAIADGFLPDAITSDTSFRNWRGPVFDLATTMSKLLGLGMSLDDVVRGVTVDPARLLGLDGEGFGRIEVGAPARLTVLDRLDEADVLVDSTGETLEVPRLEPRLVVLEADVVTSDPWRGLSAVPV